MFSSKSYESRYRFLFINIFIIMKSKGDHRKRRKVVTMTRMMTGGLIIVL